MLSQINRSLETGSGVSQAIQPHEAAMEASQAWTTTLKNYVIERQGI